MRSNFTYLLLLLVGFLSAGETLAGSPITNVTVIKVDSAHWMSGTHAGSPYRIAACKIIIVDFTDYTFVPSEKLKGESPNLIRVRTGDPTDGFVYDLHIKPDKRRYELSAATLPKGVSPLPFTGFKKPFVYSVEIGILEPNGHLEAEWEGFIEIR